MPPRTCPCPLPFHHFISLAPLPRCSSSTLLPSHPRFQDRAAAGNKGQTKGEARQDSPNLPKGREVYKESQEQRKDTCPISALLCFTGSCSNQEDIQKSGDLIILTGTTRTLRPTMAYDSSASLKNVLPSKKPIWPFFKNLIGRHAYF